MANPSLTTVGTRPALAYAGQDMDPAMGVVSSYQNESATALDAGVPAARGTASTATGLAEFCKPVGLDTDEILGPTIRLQLKDADSAQNPKYAQYEAVPVKRDGRVAVIAGEAVRGGDEVLIIVATSTDPNLCWGSSRGGVIGTGRIAMTGWKWCGTGNIAAASVAEIEGYGASRGRITT
jgi:hypothetical protein